MKITIINGPNLNLLGTRETDIYGSQNFESYLDSLKSLFENVDIDYFQSNIEGEIINFIQNSKNSDGIILNAAAYTHTSVGIGDAIKAIDTPVIEIHISNIYSREEFRKKSFISPVVNGIIAGFGTSVYQIAINSISHLEQDE